MDAANNYEEDEGIEEEEGYEEDDDPEFESTRDLDRMAEEARKEAHAAAAAAARVSSSLEQAAAASAGQPVPAHAAEEGARGGSGSDSGSPNLSSLPSRCSSVSEGDDVAAERQEMRQVEADQIASAVLAAAAATVGGPADLSSSQQTGEAAKGRRAGNAGAAAAVAPGTPKSSAPPAASGVGSPGRGIGRFKAGEGGTAVSLTSTGAVGATAAGSLLGPMQASAGAASPGGQRRAREGSERGTISRQQQQQQQQQRQRQQQPQQQRGRGRVPAEPSKVPNPKLMAFSSPLHDKSSSTVTRPAASPRYSHGLLSINEAQVMAFDASSGSTFPSPSPRASAYSSAFASTPINGPLFRSLNASAQSPLANGASSTPLERGAAGRPPRPATGGARAGGGGGGGSSAVASLLLGSSSSGSAAGGTGGSKTATARTATARVSDPTAPPASSGTAPALTSAAGVAVGVAVSRSASASDPPSPANTHTSVDSTPSLFAAFTPRLRQWGPFSPAGDGAAQASPMWLGFPFGLFRRQPDALRRQPSQPVAQLHQVQENEEYEYEYGHAHEYGEHV